MNEEQYQAVKAATKWWCEVDGKNRIIDNEWSKDSCRCPLGAFCEFNKTHLQERLAPLQRVAEAARAAWEQYMRDALSQSRDEWERCLFRCIHDLGTAVESLPSSCDPKVKP